MKRKDNTLTKMEFQIMSILWDINHSACGWDILNRFEEPKPAYTTIATYLKVLYEKKKFSYHRYMLLMRMFKSLPWLEEYQSLAKIFGTSNPDHDGVNDEEWDLTDSPIMGIVDEEFEE